MDLSTFFVGAVMLTFVATGGVAFLKWLLRLDPEDDRLALGGVVVVVCFAVTFAVRYSDWASEQAIGGKTLDQLSVISVIIVAVLLVFAEMMLWTSISFSTNALSNIGQNQPTPTQQRALDAGADRLVAAQLGLDAGGGHDGDPVTPDMRFG